MPIVVFVAAVLLAIALAALILFGAVVLVLKFVAWMLDGAPLEDKPPLSESEKLRR